jgi:hypothetical protein
MKKLLIGNAILAIAFTATPALADGNNRGTDTEVFQLRANNPAKCNLEAADYTLSLPGNSISDNDGFARADVSAAVAAELNGAGVTAWCTGSSNTLQMYRTGFTIGDGVKTSDGFNQTVAYDIAVRIAGALRSDGQDPLEGTSDGAGNGPCVGEGPGVGLTVGRFGAAGAGALVTFTAELPSFASATNPGTGGRNAFVEDANRLVAGKYESAVTIELTPGL